MDYNNRPEFPTANAKFFPVNGSVSVGLNNTGLKSVYGTTGGIKGTSVSVSSEFLYSCALDNISALTVEKGSFKPYSVNNGADITIKDGAMLDISDINTLEANNFYGGGILVMSDNGLLTINGECSEETEFRTNGGGRYNSYIVQPERMYIKTNSGDGTFTFNPYYTQQGMTFDKKSDGWYTSAAPEFEPVVLTKFDFQEDLIFVSESEINEIENEIGKAIYVVSEFTAGSPVEELAYVPFEYDIAYQGSSFYTQSELYDEEYYEGNFNDLNINFTPVENVITVSRWSNTYGLFNHIAPGIYDIEVTAPTDKGNVTRALRLVVLQDNEEENKGFIATDTNGDIRVTYINSKETDIQNAKMIAAAYKDGIMQWIKTSENDVNIKSGEHQTFGFNISDTDYDTVKLFIWDSVCGMKPYDCYKFSDDKSADDKIEDLL